MYPISHIRSFCFFVLSGLLLSAAFAQTPTAPDFGNHSSEVLTTKAWDALTAKKYDLVKAYTARCLDLYAAEAKQMQAGLSAMPPANVASTYWALNDVGTCCFISAQALEAQGKSAEALPVYKKLVKDYGFAQTWDLKGWFWSPAAAAKQRLKVLEFEAL